MADLESDRQQQKKKTFVLDTNILIHDYNALETFEENDVVIPIRVIEELDNMKSGVGEVPYSARRALRNIEIYSAKGEISKGIRLPGGGCLRVEVFEVNHFPEIKSDNLIISCAIALKEKGTPNVVVVSKDTAVRIKAGAMNVPTQDYRRDKTTLFQKYGCILKEEDYNNGISSVRYQCRQDEVYRETVKILHRSKFLRTKAMAILVHDANQIRSKIDSSIKSTLKAWPARRFN